MLRALSLCLALACSAGAQEYVSGKGLALQQIFLDGDFGAAKLSLERHLKARPDDPQANFLLALILKDFSAKPDLKRALGHLLKVHEKFPSAFTAQELARCYYELDNEAEGLKHLELSLRLKAQPRAMSQEERGYGAAELERMLADLPEMKLYMSGDPQLRDWAIAAFAGVGGCGRTCWNGTRTTMPSAVAESSDEVTDKGDIGLLIGKIGEGDAWSKASAYWSHFVFETINNRKRLRFMAANMRSRWEPVNSDTYSTQLWLAELDSYADTFAFFGEFWRPYCQRNSLKVIEMSWIALSTRRPEEIAFGIGVDDGSSYPVYRPHYTHQIFPVALEVARRRGRGKELAQGLERRHLESAEALAKARYFAGDWEKCLALAEKGSASGDCSVTLDVLGHLSALRLNRGFALCQERDLKGDRELMAWVGELWNAEKSFEAAQLLDYLAGKGDKEAKFKLYYHYFNAWGAPRDLPRLRGLLEEAAGEGSLEAKCFLAQGYLWGSLAPQDPDKALAVLKDMDEGIRSVEGLRAWAYHLKGPRFKAKALEHAAKGAELCLDYGKRLYEHLAQKPFVSEANCGGDNAKAKNYTDNMGYPELPPLQGQAVKAEGGKLLLDDFEGQAPFNRLGGKWYADADKKELGTRLDTLETFIAAPGFAGKGSYARMAGHYGRRVAPWPHASLNATLGKDLPADLSSFKAVEFLAKGDGKTYDVLLYLNQVTDFAHFKQAFTAPKEWGRVRLELDAFRQPDWGRQIPQDFRAVKELLFSSSNLDNEDFELCIDQVEFVN